MLKSFLQCSFLWPAHIFQLLKKEGINLNTHKKSAFSIIDDSRSNWMTIVMLAWPILIEQILSSLAQAVDTAMVGSLGAIATASVSISQSPNMLINGVIMALGVGFTSMIARAVGANDLRRDSVMNTFPSPRHTLMNTFLCP